MKINNLDNIELSISIVNYNTTDQVIALIDSINNSITDIIYEILVVDNASEDNPNRISTKYENVKLIKNSINLYFTKADNQNLQRAKGKYILSINSDTLVLPNAIENMLNFLKLHQEIGAVSPKFIFPDNTLQASFTPFLTFKSSFSEAFKSLFSKNKKSSEELGSIFYNPDITQEAEVLYGACIMIRREVLDTVGFKDEKFVHGWDEYDWCMRIKNGGWKLFYIHNSVIMHFRSESINNIRKDAKKIKKIEGFSKKGFYYLHRKHFGYLSSVILRLIYGIIGLKSKLLK